MLNLYRDKEFSAHYKLICIIDVIIILVLPINIDTKICYHCILPSSVKITVILLAWEPMRHCSRLAMVVGLNPTRVICLGVFFHNTPESTEYTVLTHIGVSW